MAEEIENGNGGVAGEVSPGQLEPAANERFKWYIIHAYSGFERKVRESIESRVQALVCRTRLAA